MNITCSTDLFTNLFLCIFLIIHIRNVTPDLHQNLVLSKSQNKHQVFMQVIITGDHCT